MYSHRISILVLTLLITCGCDNLPARLAAAKPAAATASDLPDFELAARLAKEHLAEKKNAMSETENPEFALESAKSYLSQIKRIDDEAINLRILINDYTLRKAPWVDVAFRAAITSEVGIATTWRTKEEVLRMRVLTSTDPESKRKAIEASQGNDKEFIEWSVKRLNLSSHEYLALLKNNAPRLNDLLAKIHARHRGLSLKSPLWWHEPDFFCKPPTLAHWRVIGLQGLDQSCELRGF